MDILILSWRDLKHPNAGGAEIATHEHAKAWAKAGNNVFWFSAYFIGAKRRERIDKVEVLREGRQFFEVQLRAFFWYFFGSHPKFDLVVDQFHGIPFFTPFYVRTKRLAFIHEVAKEVWRLNPWPKPFNLVPAFLGPILEPLIFTFYRNTPFMTVSESTKRDLISWGIPPKNISVAINGVTCPTLPKDIRKEKRKTLMYLGAISWDKGIEDTFRTFSAINKSQKGWKFWVVGKASDFFIDWMEKKAKELGISKSFKYWGFADFITKNELLARAHVLINPSVYEGWGLVNIEANFYGTPVVGYYVSGVRDSVVDGKTGYLSQLGDYGSLAENAIKLVSDSRLYGEFSKNAEAWAKKFTWESSTGKSFRLIKSL